ncbi:TetR/AcrR family transcriptional regulator [Yoonia sp. SS1-5]|uniref:TetR/AcrR family transcriptional regulator n=1 Tax=Yoonia rhodophyticola TaxID=3137370 RepID=A0AAN0NH09_9RHOB
MAKQKYNRADMLQTARDIIREKGAAKLTIQEVATRIGATKGAILHWYPSKLALIDAVVSSQIDDWDARYDENASRDPSPNAALLTYLKTWEEHYEEQASYAEAVLLLLAEEPDRLASVREAYSRYSRPYLKQADHNFDPLLLWLACEGLEALRLLKLLEVSPKLRTKIYAEIRSRATSL